MSESGHSAVIALYVHGGRDEAKALADGAASWLEGRGHRVVWEREVAEGVTVDLAVSLGGDGTMLRAVDGVAGCAAPVLGVNVGQLGYLTEVEPERMFDALEAYFDGRHRIEERMQLDVQVDGGALTQALNETVVGKVPAGHTVRLAVSLDGEFFTTFVADGLIVATPTGSTAYSFSARGPIVDPAHHAMVLTPVAPHMLFDRSMVLGPRASVRIEVAGERRAVVEADGRRVAELGEGEGVTCTSASEPARLVRFGASQFHNVLKAKFHLEDR